MPGPGPQPRDGTGGRLEGRPLLNRPVEEQDPPPAGSVDIEPTGHPTARRWFGAPFVTVSLVAVGACLTALATWSVLRADTRPAPAVASSADESPAAETENVLAFPDGYFQAVPRDFIEAIVDPQFLSADDAEWPTDADVIGVEIGGDARAYPVGVLTAREMVVDTIGGEPVLVTWCPICGTAMAHSRIVGGEVATFGVQGGLFRNAMTWYDHRTGSVWSQPLGRAIAGPLEGETVELLASTLTTWDAWREANPHTLALDAPGTATGFDLANLLIVVDIDGEVRGYPVTKLREQGVVNETVGGLPIAVISDPANQNRQVVYARQAGSSTVELAADGERLVDTATGSTFDPVTGLGLDGPLATQMLTRIPSITVEPGFGPGRTPKFTTLWPEGTVWWPPR